MFNFLELLTLGGISLSTVFKLSDKTNLCDNILVIYNKAVCNGMSNEPTQESLL
jgi:hypothetical protein